MGFGDAADMSPSGSPLRTMHGTTGSGRSSKRKRAAYSTGLSKGCANGRKTDWADVMQATKEYQDDQSVVGLSRRVCKSTTLCRSYRCTVNISGRSGTEKEPVQPGVGAELSRADGLQGREWSGLVGCRRSSPGGHRYLTI